MTNRRHLACALGFLPLAGLAKPAGLAGKKRLVMVGDANPPYILPAGHPLGDGIDVDIAREALRLGGPYSLELQRVPWRRALAMLEAGQADFSTGTRNTPDRRQFASFSGPYGRNIHHVILTRRDWAGPAVRSLAGLNGLAIGLVSGYAYPQELRAALTGRLEMALDMPTLLRMLAARRIDMAMLSEVPALWLVQELQLREQLQQQPFVYDSGAPTQMAFSLKREGHADALAAMNRGLALLAKAKAWNRFEARYLRPMLSAVGA